MRIYKLTVVASAISHALVSGRFKGFGYDDAIRRIEDGTIFDYLSHEIGLLVPVSVLAPVDRLELLIEWEQFIGCIEPYRFRAHRDGLCLLLGYLLEGIDRRVSEPRHRLTDETAVWGESD